MPPSHRHVPPVHNNQPGIPGDIGGDRPHRHPTRLATITAHAFWAHIQISRPEMKCISRNLGDLPRSFGTDYRTGVP